MVPGLGELKGKLAHSEVAVFQGIPFGKPPVADLRWMPPQAYGAWDSPRDATFHRSACPGAKKGGVVSKDESEDCLFLNVASPARNNQYLPVMVWLYGGVYALGEAKDFPIEAMVKSSVEPIVVVACNYRTNVFGFLGSKALAARSKDGTTGNYGLQDQRLALVWVRDHISAFGGNGKDVTIFGESAGGNSVLHHLVQPASFGLYEKAIIESGTYDAGYSLEAADTIYSAIAAKAGCDSSDFQCILKLNASALETASHALRYTSQLPWLHWGPVVDGVSMVDTPQQMIAAGKFNNKVPILIGSNRDEFSAFILRPSQDFYKDYPAEMTEAEFDSLLSRDLSNESIHMVKQLYDSAVYAYPSARFAKSPWWWMAMRVATDNGISAKGWPVGPALGHCSVRRIANQFLKGGTPSVYMYSFEKALLNPSVAMHGMEIPFVFGWQAALGIAPGNRQLASAMTAYWSHFAASGNPNQGGSSRSLPDWPAYSFRGDKSNVKFDASFLSADITVERNFRGAACDFWDSLASSESSTAQPIIV
jgi:para-nitrobenzyl esterase